MKAIKVTEKNIDFLASRFNILPDDKEDRFPVGYYVVTDFGNDETFDVVSEAVFLAKFVITDPELDNDWIGIRMI